MIPTSLALFEQKSIRKIRHADAWWFSVVDVVWALTDSLDPKDYWYRIKKRVTDEEWIELSTICRQLKLESSDGKKYATDCANTAGIFRIIQSIPSPKAEPFKLRLAQVWYERIQEIENPELATQRTRELYKAKWYSEDRIEKRIRGIVIREELTDEWSKRWAKWHKDYAILTAEISKATFGMTPSEYKDYKALKKENLRDHMTDLELIFLMLGERATTEITQTNDTQGIPWLKQDPKIWGKIAGDAKKALEIQTGKKVATQDNYINYEEKNKKLKKIALSQQKIR